MQREHIRARAVPQFIVRRTTQQSPDCHMPERRTIHRIG
jgi:hypothetical protein